MVNWFDLMRHAQGGAGLENFVRQFGLSPQQTNAALAAVMPALAMGLQRAATDPAAMAQLFKAMSGGHFPTFWDSGAQTFAPEARQEGKHVLDQLFGSDEVSRRVAHQAASFSGVGVDVLQQMLPLVAGIVAGGLARMATSQGALFSGLSSGPSGPAPSGAGPSGQTGAGAWADLWGQWMGAPARPQPAPAPEPEPQAKPQPQASPQPGAPTNPFEEMIVGFLRASGAPQPHSQPEPEARVEPEPEPAPEPKPAEAQDPVRAWGEMVEKGQEMQRQHLEALQSIFEGVWGRGPGRGS